MLHLPIVQRLASGEPSRLASMRCKFNRLGMVHSAEMEPAGDLDDAV
jgi:hypothetical protein